MKKVIKEMKEVTEENEVLQDVVGKRKAMNEVTKKNKERTILVGISNKKLSKEKAFASLDELELLVNTAGGEVAAKIIQERDRLDSAYFIGKGKAEYIAELSKEQNIDSIVFDEDLSPIQARNMETLTGKKILDRSEVILDIFALNARTVEAKTQVELAQLEYLLPRLTKKWTHFSKQFGGIGTKGPGETQLETDRRIIKTSISHLKEKLNSIRKQKETQRKLRVNLPRIALVGYTNVGKSTLLNLLTGSNVLIENKLFSTLDTTVRQINITPARKFLISDTVGFIRKLPHHLIVSFMSTLSEAIESDILLHVIDITNPQAEEHIAVVENTLEELKCGNKTKIMVFNKIDTLKDKSVINYYKNMFPNSVFISAHRALNINTLLEKILEIIKFELKEYQITLSSNQHNVLAKIHSLAEVIEIKYHEDEIYIKFNTTEQNYSEIFSMIKGKRKV